MTAATKRCFPLHILISALFLILMLAVGGAIGGLGYTISRNILKTTSIELTSRIGRETLREFTRIIGPAEMAARLISLDDVTQAQSLEERLGDLGIMREALNNSSELTSLYVGYANGDFFLLRRISNDVERESFEAPTGTAYIVQSIDRARNAVSGRYVFFDTNLNTLRSDDRPDYASGYDPRSRDWYVAAMNTDSQVKTPPYLFYTTRDVGTTIANRAAHGTAVVGADIRLETLNRTLEQQKATPETHLFIANRSGFLLAGANSAKLVTEHATEPFLARLTELGVPVLAQLQATLATIDEKSAKNIETESGGETWYVSITPLKLEGTDTLFLISATPEKELMAAAHALLRKLFLTMALVIAIAIPVIWVLARAVSEPLRKLNGEADAIRHFEFSKAVSVESPVLEVNDLALTMDSMKHAIRRFLEINTVVAAENNFDRLLPRLLTETIAAADADAGILYLADKEELLPATGLLADGSSLPPSPAVHNPAADSPLLEAALLARTARASMLVEADIGALGLAAAVGACGATHAVAVPLLNREQTPVGAMVLLRHDDTDAARLSFIGALSGSSAVSLETKALLRAQRQLFASMIQLIASAIDAKSAYTGGHCARVPELAKMLARAACEQTTGVYKDFNLSEDEWEALHVAAWLHDCGKVTTPEYVVDKATKLETLYDRIHEVRMRFEVLKRDAEIICLKAISAGASETETRTKLASDLARLDDDFAFVAACNEGGEFMAADKLDRLAGIAARTWQRTLDDRIGLSHEEKERKAYAPSSNLPVTEQLLADKPEHRIERLPRDTIAADNPWGVKMVAPDLLYNKGELYNLSVARGTLSNEERYKINEHIVQTLIMLSQLPFPKHLRQVPEIASGHHEKMDGTGYPRRLRGDEMSPLARMMAIADIFEALTAVDRPYKTGKTLSEAIGIMSAMKKEHHIDPDLFELFLRCGIYREYAERFMRPEQIDEVNVDALLGSESI
ncbi:MAG: HD domain-containing phosphohydrolase [Propionivibrio sp.]